LTFRNIKLNKVDKTTINNLQFLIDKFTAYNKQLKIKQLRMLSGQVVMYHEHYINQANRLLQSFEDKKGKMKLRQQKIKNSVARTDAFYNLKDAKVDTIDQFRDMYRDYNVQILPKETREVTRVIDSAICDFQNERKKFIKRFKPQRRPLGP
jgi:hypothetical protein